MNQKAWIYMTDERNYCRFALGVQGKHMLAVIAANPSTAAPGQPDHTINRIRHIASAHGYDGWIVLNLWPERQTHPENLRQRMRKPLHKRNLEIIEQVLGQFPIRNIWAAWGNIIERRKYLKHSCGAIVELSRKNAFSWIQLSPPTLKGHPRHPLYAGKQSKLISFYPESYAKEHL
ncbi:DUF1643 domain-containing protein [Robertkochia flava]|uniref:DUF1643 domain-containing protein n=1 Tax=Robertkochia flava TaxID=3447986 RepID=UPI001CCBABC7|nr:DUF1643 domain-containing protein [Robertkochia marina]